MARVTIDVSAAAGARKLSFLMGWDEEKTMGKLYRFWHDSQELEQAICSTEELYRLMNVDMNDCAVDLSTAMIDCGFIEMYSDRQFLIRGNQKHIDNLKQRKQAASIGGKNSVKSKTLTRSSVRLKNFQANALSETQASDVASTVQYSTVHKEKTIAQTEFERIYQKYPRKEGKSRGIAKAKSQIKTPEDLALLEKAIDRYRDHCVREGKEKQFVMHFSTFMASWRDYLDDDVGKVDLPNATPVVHPMLAELKK